MFAKPSWLANMRGIFDKYHKAIDIIVKSNMANVLLWQAAKCADALASLPADSTPTVPKKKKTKSKEATTQEEVMEDVADLDDAAALELTTTQ